MEKFLSNIGIYKKKIRQMTIGGIKKLIEGYIQGMWDRSGQDNCRFGGFSGINH